MCPYLLYNNIHVCVFNYILLSLGNNCNTYYDDNENTFHALFFFLGGGTVVNEQHQCGVPRTCGLQH